ncbi:hypothetical protein JAAARDRAFT_198137 [Jaapia argillacea MUCL 33604]|uniref:Uncharacterized protein n=1 Tax=Jaapia argillacea MUCL 33604 TaxID=933084 RepID=A0A067PC68_9AGAM|nr:hypothetical protein JAAARDRAFT_198137 [Jaapia argillacea MUCL 33604]
MVSPIALVVLLASVLSAFAAVAPRGPSGVPSTCYACPSQDNAGFSIGTYSNDGTTLFCSYPATAGENPTDFYCDYSATTGVLGSDADGGYCPSSAPATVCGSRKKKRSPVFEKEMKRVQARAAAPQPQTSHSNLAARMAFGKKKQMLAVRDKDEA